MKTTTYPKQHMTEIADMQFGSPRPERVMINETYLALEISERIDDQDKLEIFTGDEDIDITVDLKISWEEVEPADESVGFRGRTVPCIHDITILAFYEGAEIGVICNEQKLIDKIYNQWS